MRKLYDSVDAAGIPADATLMAGYVDHQPDESYYAMKTRFPNANVRSICIDPAHMADILDIETFDARPDQAPAWAVVQRMHLRNPVCYQAWATLPQVVAAFTLNRVAQPLYWVAKRDTQTIPTYPGVTIIGNQYEDAGPYDVSNFVDYVPGWDPIPPDPPEEEDMKDYFVEYQGGFWVVAHDLSSRQGIKGGDTVDNYNAIWTTGQYLQITLGAAQMASIPDISVGA